MARDGRVVAALLHDPVVADETVTRAIAGAAFMLLENDRLVHELRASRARIVTTAETDADVSNVTSTTARQQRLLALKLKLDDLRLRTDPAAAAELRAAGEDLSAALGELRGIAHGISTRPCCSSGA